MQTKLSQWPAWAFSSIDGKRKKVVAVITVGLSIFLLLAIVVPILVEWKPRADDKLDVSVDLFEDGTTVTSADMVYGDSSLQPVSSQADRPGATRVIWDDDDGVSNSYDPSKEVAQVLEATLSSFSPSRSPTDSPSLRPTISRVPTTMPTVNVTFYPGWLTHEEHGLKLSSGLTARILARSGQKVQYADGSESSIPFHDLPDFGATFVDTRANNPHGWIYLSNAEVENGQGGVGALTFDADGNVIKYEMLLTGTTMNCGGGRTPWNTWISCEETDGGRNFQVHPEGLRDPAPIILGANGGHWESFSFDARDLSNPHFYVTEDADRGAMQRFTPYNPNWDDPWNILDLEHANGTIDYLVLEPTDASRGTYRWTSNRGEARGNAALYYPNSEGIDVDGSSLYFVCKNIKQIFEVNLDDGTYKQRSTVSGIFDGGPDQLQRILTDTSDNFLFFTEEGGKDPGIHGRNEDGDYFTLFESPIYEDETTGLAFSPDAKHLYVAYQKNGILFDITRTDKWSFGAKALNVKFHAANDN